MIDINPKLQSPPHRTFDEMLMRDLVPGLASYNSAIRGCTQEGEWEMAVSLVLGACVLEVEVII